MDWYEDMIRVFAKKIDTPKSFIFPFATRKVNTIIFNEGGQAFPGFKVIKLLTLIDNLFPSLGHFRY